MGGDVSVVNVVERALALVRNFIASSQDVIDIHDVFLWLFWIDSRLCALDVIGAHLVADEFAGFWHAVLK